jgi:hypothetical protein
MELDSHVMLRLAHLILFAYWLGADLGVFMGGGYMSRPGLAMDDRNQIRKFVMDIDLAPRIALVAMLPVGFQLSLEWGAPVATAWLPAIWIAATLWIAALISIHFVPRAAMVSRLSKVDLILRYLLMVVLAVTGVRIMLGAAGDVPAWLGAKLLVFVLILIVGVRLRRVAAQWYPAMERFAAGDEAGGQTLLNARRSKAKITALIMWALVAVAAVLGAIKPF